MYARYAVKGTAYATRKINQKVALPKLSVSNYTKNILKK
jgi:hypothetical protein